MSLVDVISVPMVFTILWGVKGQVSIHINEHIITNPSGGDNTVDEMSFEHTVPGACRPGNLSVSSRLRILLSCGIPGRVIV